MKISTILGLLTGFTVLTITIAAQPFPKVTYNYKNCSFTIAAGKWTKQNGKDILTVTTTLSNSSDDTLKYATELCFEERLGHLVDTTNFSDALKYDDCLKNYPVTVMVPPHKNKKTTFFAVKKYRGTKTTAIQLSTTVQFVNIDVFKAEIDAVLKQTNFQDFFNQLSAYKMENEHTFLSNTITIRPPK